MHDAITLWKCWECVYGEVSHINVWEDVHLNIEHLSLGSRILDYCNFLFYTLPKYLESSKWAYPLNRGRETSTVPVKVICQKYVHT